MIMCYTMNCHILTFYNCYLGLFQINNLAVQDLLGPICLFRVLTFINCRSVEFFYAYSFCKIRSTHCCCIKIITFWTLPLKPLNAELRQIFSLHKTLQLFNFFFSTIPLELKWFVCMQTVKMSVPYGRLRKNVLGHFIRD